MIAFTSRVYCATMNRNGTMCRHFTGLLLVSEPRSTHSGDRAFRVACPRHVRGREQVHCRINEVRGVRL